MEFKLIFLFIFLRALELNQYSHITATYFLLAERMLRERQEKEQHSQTRSPSPSKAQFRYVYTWMETDGCRALSDSNTTRLTADGQTEPVFNKPDRLRIDEKLQISISIFSFFIGR